MEFKRKQSLSMAFAFGLGLIGLALSALTYVALNQAVIFMHFQAVSWNLNMQYAGMMEDLWHLMPIAYLFAFGLGIVVTAQSHRQEYYVADYIDIESWLAGTFISAFSYMLYIIVAFILTSLLTMASGFHLAATPMNLLNWTVMLFNYMMLFFVVFGLFFIIWSSLRREVESKNLAYG